MALDIEMFGGEDKALPVTLRDADGVIIPRSALASPGIFVGVWASYDTADGDPLFTLSDLVATEIQWTDEAGGQFLIIFPGSITIAHRGAGMYFQTVAKMADGKNFVPEDGTGNITLKDNKVGRK